MRVSRDGWCVFTWVVEHEQGLALWEIRMDAAVNREKRPAHFVLRFSLAQSGRVERD